MSVVDLATYNKALSEKNKLSSTLKNLQQASKHALDEFNQLKQRHIDLRNEADLLRESLSVLSKQKSSVESQLSHSEFLLKRMVKVSKAAITEFNEVKQRYCDEYDRRRAAETTVLTLTHQLQELNQVPQASANKPENLPQILESKASSRASKLEHELSNVKLKLMDTMTEFSRFREASQKEQQQLESNIINEIRKLKEDRSSPAGTLLRGRPQLVQLKRPSLSDATQLFESPKQQQLPPQLEKEIKQGTKLRKTPIQSPTSDTAEGMSRFQKQNISIYPNGGFGELGALLSRQATLSRNNISSPPRDFVHEQRPSEELLIQDVQDRLIEETRGASSTMQRSYKRAVELSSNSDKGKVSDIYTKAVAAEKRKGFVKPEGISTQAFSQISATASEHRPQSTVTLVGNLVSPDALSSYAHTHDSIYTSSSEDHKRTSLEEIQGVFDELEEKLGVEL